MDIIIIVNYFIAFFAVFTVVFYFLLLFTYKKDYDEEPEIDERYTPLVSIIIPAYNEEKCMGKCLRSILQLDYPKEKLEIIIIDDGSTDQTQSEAKKFEEHGVKIYTQKNSGKGAALNRGIGLAKGEFIVTMDADSEVMPKTLKQLLAFFRKDGEVAVVTPAIKIKQSKNLLVELQRIEYLMIIFSRKLLSFIDSVPVAPGPFSIFRTSVFKEIGGFDENNLVEDQEIVLRLQKHNFKIRSSVKADVFTEPPNNIKDLLRQRVRWQRGGVRNYWNYRHLINPKYGDFGLFFIPLNFITLAAFFTIFGLMVNALLSKPYYIQYVLLESMALGVSQTTVPLFFAGAASVIWLALVLKSFEKEKVGIIPIILYYFFYWYLMLGYNTLMVFQELKMEKYSW